MNISETSLVFVFIEMWESLCFYGMRGVLTIFRVDKLLGLSLSDKDADLEYGAIQAFVYGW
jgi:POT family proton-dependent oligopeptide transporter